MREVARSAVRDELAAVALRLFRERGFENVTITDAAEAAGVSRSTFLRYFATKEDAVLCALEPRGETIAAALRARPAGEDAWTALRRALDPLIAETRDDPAAALALAKLISQSPALRNAHAEKQGQWRALLAEALADRLGLRADSDMRPALLAGAMLDALQVASDRWRESDGKPDLRVLADSAAEILTPRNVPGERS
jgi:AcrR family transcriptional regulator